MRTSKAYSQDLVDQYDHKHFGGASGRVVLQRDINALVALTGPKPGPILDIPSGTGVYAQALHQRGYVIIAADASAPMLEITARRLQAPRVLCDIYHLPFKDSSVTTTTTLRLLSHFPQNQLLPMLQELRRVVSSGGRVVFDTFRWTPRRWPILRRFVEQSFIYVISDLEMERIIAEADLRVGNKLALYLFSPIWLRKLPLLVVHALSFLERLVPKAWRLRVFWAVTPDEGMQSVS